MNRELPAGLSLEAAAWVETRIALENARRAAALQTEIEKVDEWANGIFAALRDLLMHQLLLQPELALGLAADWRQAALGFERIDAKGEQPRPGESLEYLEARKMLYEAFTHLGLMPAAARRPEPPRRAA